MSYELQNLHFDVLKHLILNYFTLSSFLKLRKTNRFFYRVCEKLMSKKLLIHFDTTAHDDVDGFDLTGMWSNDVNWDLNAKTDSDSYFNRNIKGSEGPSDILIKKIEKAWYEEELKLLYNLNDLFFEQDI